MNINTLATPQHPLEMLIPVNLWAMNEINMDEFLIIQKDAIKLELKH